jgi:hypothetical protein
MEGQTVYSSFECLDEVFLFRDNEHEFLYNIITKYSNVMIDIGENEFEKLLKDNPFIKSLLKRPHKNIYPLKKFFDNIDDEDLSIFPRDIFLLDKPKSFCDSRIDKYGVLVLSAESLSDVVILCKRQHKSYTKGDETDNNENIGWRSFIDSFELQPINSLVIIDNYIFNNENSGKNNLINLIGSLLPKNLEISFQVLIVIDNRSAIYNLERLEVLKNEIQHDLRNNVEYEINVGIVTHPLKQEFADRFLISNYHIIESSHGFDCYNNDGMATRDHQSTILSAFYTLRNSEGDPEVKLMCRKLKQVKKLVEGNNIPNTSTNLLVGDCKNRLLSDF